MLLQQYNATVTGELRSRNGAQVVQLIATSLSNDFASIEKTLQVSFFLVVCEQSSFAIGELDPLLPV